MKKKARIEIKREVKTFCDLSNGAYILLEKSKENVEGSYYTTMASILFSAFTFEAFLNHLGSKKIKFWEEMETISVNNKYAVLCKEFDVTPQFGVRPYQTIKSLFQFRNAIAHGKSQILEIIDEVDPSVDLKDFKPKTKWEEYCTEANAERAREDVRKIILELSEKAGEGNSMIIGGFTTSHMSI